MTKIIDAFTFLNEIDLVKARLEYYNDIVTDFVIIESNQTWRHQKNQTFFNTILDTLPIEIKNKIHYVVCDWPDKWIDDAQGVQEKWVENGTREQALIEIKKFANLDDWVIMNDLDEFWDKDKFKLATEEYFKNGQLVWVHSNRQCFVDWYTPAMPEWPGSKMAQLKDITTMAEFYCSKNKALRVKTPGQKTLFHPMYGGWHFTKMGDLLTKAKSLGSIREWRTWEPKIGKTPEQAAHEIFYGKGWNSVVKKGKQKTAYCGQNGITKELFEILKKTKIFWSNGLKP
jgi:hypothetical protein